MSYNGWTNRLVNVWFVSELHDEGQEVSGDLRGGERVGGFTGFVADLGRIQWYQLAEHYIE